MPFVTTWIVVEDIILNEINRMEEDKYCMVSLNMWNLRKSDSGKQGVE